MGPSLQGKSRQPRVAFSQTLQECGQAAAASDALSNATDALSRAIELDTDDADAAAARARGLVAVMTKVVAAA